MPPAELADAPLNSTMKVVPMEVRVDGEQALEYRYQNRPGRTQVTLRLADSDETMRPTLSTQLAIENLDITPGDAVLDLGAGTGAVALAARMLGAGSVTALEVVPSAREDILQNMALNRQEDIEIIIGDLFEPLADRRFDQIIANPPSMPCPPELDLAPPYNGGPEGRRFHEVIQRSARDFLTDGGRLVLVHSSLCGLDRSMDNLRRLGYRPEIVARARERFLDWYPIEHLCELKERNMADFVVLDGTYHVDRYVISAVLE